MTQETMMFSAADVKALAEHVLETSFDFDQSGSRTHSGLRYCTGCGAYDYGNGKGMVHETDCVSKIAQDVLTGLVPNA